jgi:hypothetical protein
VGGPGRISPARTERALGEFRHGRDGYGLAGNKSAEFYFELCTIDHSQHDRPALLPDRLELSRVDIGQVTVPVGAAPAFYLVSGRYLLAADQDVTFAEE